MIIQPIFNKQIAMWADLGFNIPIEEGMYWLDHGIIKAFQTETGILLNLYKYIINDDLTIIIKEHKDFNKNKDKLFESWNKTVERYSQNLDILEQESVDLIKSKTYNTNRRIINTNSTGKDSMVMLKLAEKSEIKFETYFNVTTLDVKESNCMAKECGFKFTFPQKPYNSFYKFVKDYDIVPSRLNRFCCEKFKENATIDEFDANEKLLFLFGMRNDESNSRSGYTDVWVNHKWGDGRDWVGILPIRKWTDLDIWLYTFRENIRVNEKYKMGYSRVGCAISCPNYGKSTWVLDKHWYPKLYERWQNILKDNFIRNNKWIIMNCTTEEYCSKYWTGGVAYSEPSDGTIQEYAEHNNLPLNVAVKYFNRNCMNGCTRKDKLIKIKDKEVLSMNMKLNGRNIEKFMCKKCLMRYLEIDKVKWSEMAKGFKENGCSLF